MPARLGNNPKAFNDHHHNQGGAPKKVAREVQKGSKESSYQIPLVPMNLRKVNQIEINNNSQPINIHSTKRCFQTPEWLQEMRPNRNKEIQCKTDPDRYPDRKLRELALAKQNTQTSRLSIAKANTLASQVLATERTTWGSMVEA